MDMFVRYLSISRAGYSFMGLRISSAVTIVWIIASLLITMTRFFS